MSDYVAVLGFAEAFLQQNKTITFEAGQQLAAANLGIVTGNLVGTAEYAFKGAKLNSGTTLAIIEQTLNYPRTQYCDTLEIVPSQSCKHQRIVEHCIGALIIGGGIGTLKLVKLFLSNGKPVVVIENSSGITDNELRQTQLRQQVSFQPTIKKAIKNCMKF